LYLHWVEKRLPVADDFQPNLCVIITLKINLLWVGIVDHEHVFGVDAVQAPQLQDQGLGQVAGRARGGAAAAEVDQLTGGVDGGAILQLIAIRLTS
jgi:hypothetical protein